MSDKKKNTEYYQNTFDEVHASEDLLRKVMCMKNENGMKRVKRTLRVGYVAAAIAVLVFFSSNVITYAATGSTWVSDCIGKVRIFIDGDETFAELKKSVDKDGNVSYEADIEVDGEKGHNVFTIMEGDPEE